MKKENIEDIVLEEEIIEQDGFVPAPEGSLYAEYDGNYKIKIMNQIEAFEKKLPIIEFEVAYNGELYVKGHCPEEPEVEIIARRVAELKAKLDDTDWIIDKISEAEKYRPEQVPELIEKYRPIAEERESWRLEIDSLENKLK